MVEESIRRLNKNDYSHPDCICGRTVHRQDPIREVPLPYEEKASRGNQLASVAIDSLQFPEGDQDV